MLYLFLGYASVQSYSFIKVLAGSNYPLSVFIFSLAVFLIWSFIPVLGYFFAKLIGAKGKSHKFALLVFGLSAGLFEKALYHFDIITFNGDMLGTIIVGILLFCSAFISIKPPTNNKQTITQ